MAAPGQVLASGCYDGIVRLWAAEAGSGSGGDGGSLPLASFAAHKGPIKAVLAAPIGAGRLLVTAGNDMVARVWRGVPEAAAAAAGGGGAAQPEVVAVLRGHGEGIEAAVASPDGAWCCTGGWDSKLLLWRSGGWCL